MTETTRPAAGERTEAPKAPADLQPEATGAERGNASQTAMKQTSKTSHESGDELRSPDEGGRSKR